MLRNYSAAELLPASQEGLNSNEYTKSCSSLYFMDGIVISASVLLSEILKFVHPDTRFTK
jgi:hypothetical protein